MSDKDVVKQAALDALKRPTEAKKAGSDTKSQAKPAKSEPKPAKSGQTDKKTAPIRLSEPSNPVPQKGSAEAAVHNMAARAARDGHTPARSNSGMGFLLFAVFLPLWIVGGLYAYATYVQNKDFKAELASTTADKPTDTATSPTGGTTKSDQAPQSPPATGSEATQAKAPQSEASTNKTPPETTPAPASPTSDKQATKPATATAKTPDKSTPAEKSTAAKIHWDYKSTDWAALDPSFKTCGEGRSQSPIDIPAGFAIESRLAQGPVFRFNYAPAAGKVVNTGHSIEVDLEQPKTGFKNRLLVNGQPYDLIQFHFHTPGEHRINGQGFPMEAHLVHKNARNQIAVVAVMFIPGGHNRLIDRMPLPARKGEFATSRGAHINPALLLPADRRSYTFSGSLTTPPCTQNVGWIVLRTPLAISATTLARFQKIMGRNNRPVQALNGRLIYRSN